MFQRMMFLLLIAGALTAGLWYSQWCPVPNKISGFIEAHDIRVGSRVGGRVATVNVDEGAHVTPGQILVTLDPFDLKQQIAEAQARRAQLKATLDKLIAGPRQEEIAAAQGYLDVAKSQVGLAELNFSRINTAFERHAAAQDELDRATESLRSARAMLTVRQQQHAELVNGTRPEDLAEARAALAAADAAIDAIQQRLDELTIRAPADGQIEAVDLEPGDIVAPNAPVLTMIDRSTYWVRAYLPENMLRYHVGDQLLVTVDSFPNRTFAAHITFIARQAEFTPGNVQTPEDRSKQVFRVKVTLDEGLDVLRPGMNADVWLDRKPSAHTQPDESPHE